MDSNLYLSRKYNRMIACLFWNDTITIEWADFKGRKASKCDVTLEDAYGTQVTCVLWESFADELKSFMESKKNEDKEPVLVALQFAKISTFKGKTFISTMKHATRFFISPEIQQVKEFILRRGTGNLLSCSITNISSSGGEFKSEDWLNGSLARTIKQMVNSDEVGTYICKGTIRDIHPTESWFYEACGNDRCYKGIAKGSKVGDQCKKCKRPIGSIHIRYLMKVLINDDDDDMEQATYFTLFEDCALYFLKKTANQLMEEMENETGDRNGTPEALTIMLDRQCLFKVEVGTRFGDRTYTVKKITEDVDIMANFSKLCPDEEVASRYKGSTNFTEKNANEKDHIEVIEESCSNSTSTQITPQKRSPNDLYRDHTGGDDLQLSSTKILKK
ncbi:uncharacterized protein LOC130986150 isoform X2 [Salvia miltiorrhiza]|uniref:uncharacterized protein LOC130986150 isoform X2 n=1 Tax=Salvia miltiorrhiza TaxID=226208 RepID=UPI0025ABC689|nr:uncharacterized protein LOC130986150 isoform X2 [Salvia miltiorrhiza]